MVRTRVLKIYLKSTSATRTHVRAETCTYTAATLSTGSWSVALCCALRPHDGRHVCLPQVSAWLLSRKRAALVVPAEVEGLHAHRRARHTRSPSSPPPPPRTAAAAVGADTEGHLHIHYYIHKYILYHGSTHVHVRVLLVSTMVTNTFELIN
jgi:hypothetical protein